MIVKVSGVPGFDGEYEWDPENQFNGHELHLIKKVSGVRLGEISEALGAGDYDLVVAIAAIMVVRSGRATRKDTAGLVELLLDAEGGKITFEDDGAEADASPPADALPSSSANDESSTFSSSVSRSTGDDPQETTPVSIGSPGWDIGVT